MSYLASYDLPFCPVCSSPTACCLATALSGTDRAYAPTREIAALLALPLVGPADQYDEVASTLRDTPYRLTMLLRLCAISY
eukprot:2422568-Rhodomonas_salina.2